MSTGASLTLIIGSVVAVAAVWILITRRSARSSRATVQWLRPRDGWMAHAFPTVELRAELAQIEALAWCGRWPVAELICDDNAVRCASCERAVERMVHRHR